MDHRTASHEDHKAVMTLQRAGDVPQISVCLTVKNSSVEAAALLSCLKAQVSAPPFMVSVVDGCSDDGTYEVLESAAADGKLVMRIEQVAGNIATGRNRAIRNAATPFILTTDVGVDLPDNWLATISEPLMNRSVPFVAGAFLPKPCRGWQGSITAAISPLFQEFVEGKVLPSARSAGFLYADFQRLGGFPEHLDHSEDLILFKKMADAVAPVQWVLSAPVLWDGRPDLTSYYRQYRAYARGDAMGHIYMGRHLFRFGFYSLVMTCLFGRGLLPRGVALMAWLRLIRRPYRRVILRDTANPPSGLTVVIQVSIVQLVGDIAKMHGYVRGLLDRRSAGGVPFSGRTS